MAYGLINADIHSDSQGGVLAPISSVMRNRIINGQMQIDQRNSGASITGNDYTFPVDRFFISASQGSKLTAQQNAGSVTLPAGFKNYLGLTSSSAYSVGAGDYFLLSQLIEGLNVYDLGWGTANAKTVTLSFQVYSSLTGTFGGSLRNSADNRSYPFTYSVPVANTWTTISITVAGDTSGAWLTTNGVGLKVTFGLGVGSTYSGTAGSWAGSAYFSATGATSVVGTNGATFYITGVQLEKGSSATGYEYRQIQQELALCQRYYQRTSAGSGYKYITALGSGVNGTLARSTYQLKVTLRDVPSSVDFSNIAVDDNATVTAITSVTIFSGSSVDSVGLNLTAASGLTQYRPYFGTSNASAGYIGISSEL